jgi:DNA-binding MarR family transcriptional regulator
MPRRPSALQAELRQRTPFASLGAEATVSLLRTASVVRRSLARVVEREGLSLAQYNVLRILRGAGDAGLPTLAIRDRLIEEAPGITRLVDKLEGAGLLRRERSTPDRRQVVCYLTARGRALLRRLDAAVAAADAAAVASLTKQERRRLVQLLERIRGHSTERVTRNA